MAIALAQLASAVVPGFGMLRNARKHTIEGGDRLDIAPHSVQRIAAVEQRSRMIRKHRERAIEFGDGFIGPAELGKRIAAVDPGEMPRLEPQHLVEAGKRLLGAMLDQQQETAVVASLDVSRNERERPVELCERFGIAAHRPKRKTEIRQRVGRSRLDLERGSDEPIGLSGFPRLQLQRTEQVQNVEMRRRGFEDPYVDLLRILKSALLVQSERLLERLRNSGQNGRQSGFRHRLPRL